MILLHTLLLLVRQRLAPNAATPEYDAHDITPSKIHRSRRDHERALFLLARELGELARNTGKVST